MIITNAFNVDNVSLSGGTDDYAATNVEIATAYEKFNDTENVDISLLLCGYLKQVLTFLAIQKQLYLWILQLQEKIVWHLFHLQEQML